MSTSAPLNSTTSDAPDPKQKKRLILGVAVWVGGVALCLAMIPVVNATNLADGLKATINGILVLGAPKIFLLSAIAIMGKPGFAYLKSLLGSHLRRMAPPAVVSPVRYRIGLIMFITLVILGSIGPYIAVDSFPMFKQYRSEVALAGDLLLLTSLFILGGDFWDKLRALFVRDAKVVFPEK